MDTYHLLAKQRSQRLVVLDHGPRMLALTPLRVGMTSPLVATAPLLATLVRPAVIAEVPVTLLLLILFLSMDNVFEPSRFRSSFGMDPPDRVLDAAAPRSRVGTVRQLPLPPHLVQTKKIVSLGCIWWLSFVRTFWLGLAKFVWDFCTETLRGPAVQSLLSNRGLAVVSPSGPSRFFR